MIVTLCLLITVSVGVIVWMIVRGMAYRNDDRVFPNVYIAGVNVGGMTAKEAKTSLMERFAGAERGGFCVTLPDQELYFGTKTEELATDIDRAVEQAYAYGRDDGSPFALSRAYHIAQRNRNDIDLFDSVELDTQELRWIIENAAEQADQEVVESSVSATDNEITVVIGKPGQRLDVEKLYEKVYEAFMLGDYEGFEFGYEIIYPAEVTLDALYAELTMEPVDAYYDEETARIVPARDGQRPQISLEEAERMLAEAQSGDELVFPFEAVPADETVIAPTKEPAGGYYQDTLASYGSIYDPSQQGRSENLRLACAAIDGTVIQPGAVFSFNDTVGERTTERGYESAIVYVSGNSVMQTGGGVCQVASTIYYCAMYADLGIVEREPHMYLVTYVPGGLDATVYWGSIDFQFENTTDYPIRIDAELRDGKCCIALMGTDVDHNRVEIESECIATNPFSTITRSGNGENVSGYTGYTYQITRRVYDADGSLIRRDTPEDLGNLGISTYSKRDEIVYTGRESSPGPSEAPVPSLAPEEPDPEPTVEPAPEPSGEPEPEIPPSEEPEPGFAPSPEPEEPPEPITEER